MAIYRTATFMVRPESIDKCKEEIQRYVSQISGHEPGTRLYFSLQDDVNPSRFFHFYVFENEAAEKSHNSAAITKALSAALGPELNGPVSFGDYSLIAESE